MKWTVHSKIIPVNISVFVVTACTNSVGDSLVQGTDVSHFNHDYFPDKVEVNYPKNFTVSYHGNYKVVQTRVDYGTTDQTLDSISWTKVFTDVMVPVQKGTSAPSLIGELESAHVIEVAVSTIAGITDDAPTRFIALEVTEKILRLGHRDMYDAGLHQRFDNDELQPIGISRHTGPILDMLVTLKSEVTLLTAASLTQADGIQKTRQPGLKVAPEISWSETTYLGQLEWIKYDALFLNTDAKANEFFDVIKTRCDSFSTLVADKLAKPSAMWAMHSRGGNWVVRCNGGIAELIKSAGAVNLFEDDAAAITLTKASGLSEGISISDEIFLRRVDGIEFIFTFQSTTENWPIENYMSSFPSCVNGKHYHHFKRFKNYGASDWYQTTPMRPDLLLSDPISLFHPDVLPNHGLFFMEPIKKVN